ncbi:hypothetical protein EDC04DRAFT_2598478 [Pisolithus marmoratus]|nr:hypothetical protein EDC04DRAFT_2598478 [Pisolithus marmoratus]
MRATFSKLHCCPAFLTAMSLTFLHQASQLPSASASTTPASHTIGLLHHTYLDSLNLAVNAEFHFLTCQICQTALAPGEVKHHLTKLHGTQSRYNDHQFKLAISALKMATELPSHITGPRPMVRGMAMTASFKAPSHHAKAQFLETLQGTGTNTLSRPNSTGWLHDIPGLKDVVEAYYEEAIPLLDRTGELVLQRLNSPDPIKSISNTPFHKHLYKSTMKKYI